MKKRGFHPVLSVCLRGVCARACAHALGKNTSCRCSEIKPILMFCTFAEFMNKESHLAKITTWELIWESEEVPVPVIEPWNALFGALVLSEIPLTKSRNCSLDVFGDLTSLFIWQEYCESGEHLEEAFTIQVKGWFGLIGFQDTHTGTPCIF